MKKLMTAVLVLILVMIIAVCSGCNKTENGSAKDLLYFDALSAGWENADSIHLYLSDLDSGDRVRINGKCGDNSIWSFDMSDADVRIEHVYTVSFQYEDTDSRTYPLLMDPSCYGDTAYADELVIEDPNDDCIALPEVLWHKSTLGPVLRITSIGNVVGETVPANTSPYQMFVDFLAMRDKGGLSYMLQYNGRSVQSNIDAVAGALKLTKEEVQKAIEEAGTIGHSVTGEKTDWSKLWNPKKYKVPVGSGKTGNR